MRIADCGLRIADCGLANVSLELTMDISFFLLLVVLLWPITLAVWYQLLLVQLIFELRPFGAVRGRTWMLFILECLWPVLAYLILVAVELWQPFPRSAEWGDDGNGKLGAILALVGAVVLYFATLRASKVKAVQ
jgi:hypothetical protein